MPCGCPRVAHIVEAAAFVKKLRLGGVQIFGVVIRVHCPPAKGNRPPPGIPDRIHDPAPKCIIRPPALGRRLGQPRPKDQRILDILGLQVIPKPLPLVRREADFPLLQGLRRQPAPGKIVARGPCRSGAQLQPEILHRQLHHLGQLRALIRLLLRARVLFGHGHPSLTRQNLYRFHKADILGLAHERDRVPLGVTPETIIESLAVIDVEAGGFFLVERARSPHIALALIGLARIPHHFAPHHL